MELWVLNSEQLLICESIKTNPMVLLNFSTILLCVRTVHGAYLQVKRTVASWELICGRCLKTSVYGMACDM